MCVGLCVCSVNPVDRSGSFQQCSYFFFKYIYTISTISLVTNLFIQFSAVYTLHYSVGHRIRTDLLKYGQFRC